MTQPRRNLRHQSLAQEYLALKHTANRGDHSLRAFAFHQITTRTGTHCSLTVDHFVMHRENDHGKIWILISQVLYQLKAGTMLQGKIDQDNIRRRLWN